MVSWWNENMLFELRVNINKEEAINNNINSWSNKWMNCWGWLLICEIIRQSIFEMQFHLWSTRIIRRKEFFFLIFFILVTHKSTFLTRILTKIFTEKSKRNERNEDKTVQEYQRLSYSLFKKLRLFSVHSKRILFLCASILFIRFLFFSFFFYFCIFTMFLLLLCANEMDNTHRIEYHEK